MGLYWLDLGIVDACPWTAGASELLRASGLLYLSCSFAVTFNSIPTTDVRNLKISDPRRDAWPVRIFTMRVKRAHRVKDNVASNQGIERIKNKRRKMRVKRGIRVLQGIFNIPPGQKEPGEGNLPTRPSHMSSSPGVVSPSPFVSSQARSYRAVQNKIRSTRPPSNAYVLGSRRMGLVE